MLGHACFIQEHVAAGCVEYGRTDRVMGVPHLYAPGSAAGKLHLGTPSPSAAWQAHCTWTLHVPGSTMPGKMHCTCADPVRHNWLHDHSGEQMDLVTTQTPEENEGHGFTAR